jgi:hypothetical protein
MAAASVPVDSTRRPNAAGSTGRSDEVTSVRRAIACAAAGSVTAIWLAAVVEAQSPARGEADAFTVALGHDPGQWIDARQPVQIVFSRPLRADEGRLAVVLDDTDVSAVLRPIESGLEYRPEAMPLPSGERALVVYRVSAGADWRRVAEFRLRIRTPRGFEEASHTPVIDVQNKGQIVERRTPDNAPGGRRNAYQDALVNLGWRSTLRRGGWTTAFRGAVQGASHGPDRIRFATAGESAPAIDLVSYGAAVTGPAQSLALGDVVINGHRHLASNFVTRGATGRVSLSPRVDAGGVAASGAQQIGWRHALGFTEAGHRWMSGTVGVEALPEPGALRLAASVVSGSRLPVAGVNQGVVNDAERSRGFGLQVSGGGERLRLDGGWSRSRFVRSSTRGSTWSRSTKRLAARAIWTPATPSCTRRRSAPIASRRSRPAIATSASIPSIAAWRRRRCDPTSISTRWTCTPRSAMPPPACRSAAAATTSAASSRC